MLISKRLLMALFLLWVAPCDLAAQTFKAELTHAQWNAISAPPVCSMVHIIPGLGKAVFTQSANKGKSFHIELDNMIFFPVGNFSIKTLPPMWRTKLQSVAVGQVKAVTGLQPIRIESALVGLVLTQLAQGNNVLLESQLKLNSPLRVAADTSDAYRIIVEAKNFIPAYKIFQQCRGEAITNALEQSDQQIELAKIRDYDKRDVIVYGEKMNARANGAPIIKTYVADIVSADWQSFSNPFFCSFVHRIPSFGKAIFSRDNNGEKFQIEIAEKIYFPLGAVSIDTLPSAWRNTRMPINIGSAMAVAGAKPITLTANNVTQIIAQLARGTKVMFTSEAAQNSNVFQHSGGGIRVVVESKNFASGYQHYQHCISELIPYTFTQVARTLINYEETSVGLSTAAKAELAKAVRYMKADTNILGILVDAHSDGLNDSVMSEANSKLQADWVTAYLLGQGIAADKIISRWHGDKFPVASNTTANGRAQNRRVTVRLETENTRQAAKKNAAKRKAELEAEKLSPNKTKLTPEDINKMVEGLDLISP